MTPLGYIPVAALGLLFLLTLAVAVGVATPALRRRDRGRAVRNMARALLVGAVLAVVVLTLALVSRTVAGVNLRPGASIASELGNVNQLMGMLNIAGPVLLFAPIGLLLPVAFGTRWLTSTLSCSGLSLTVEVVQYFIIGRSADIDDVLLNTLGGAVGAALGILAVKALASTREPGATVEVRGVGSA